MLKFRNIYFTVGWISISFIIIFAFVFQFYINFTRNEIPENELWRLKVGDNVSDVKFKRGKPNNCVYDDKMGIDYCSYIENFKPISFLKFKGNILQEVGVIEGRDEKFRSLWGKDFENFQREFSGFSSYSSNRSGEKRIYCNPKRHIAVGFENNKITYVSVFMNECPKFSHQLSISNQDSIISEQIPEIAVDPDIFFRQPRHRSPNEDDLKIDGSAPDLPSLHRKEIKIVPIESPDESSVDPNDYQSSN